MCASYIDHGILAINKIMSLVGKWMELEVIMLSEINQAQKAKYCMFSLIYGT
jgi:hypothetical protein